MIFQFSSVHFYRFVHALSKTSRRSAICY